MQEGDRAASALSVSKASPKSDNILVISTGREEESGADDEKEGTEEVASGEEAEPLGVGVECPLSSFTPKNAGTNCISAGRTDSTES